MLSYIKYNKFINFQVPRRYLASNKKKIVFTLRKVSIKVLYLKKDTIRPSSTIASDKNEESNAYCQKSIEITSP